MENNERTVEFIIIIIVINTSVHTRFGDARGVVQRFDTKSFKQKNATCTPLERKCKQTFNFLRKEILTDSKRT